MSFLSRYSQSHPTLYNIITLSYTTGISQVIPILSSLILTRLYLPEVFGAFAAILVFSSFLIVAACGRYDMALLLPKEDSQALTLFYISVYIAIAFSGLFLLGIFLFKPEIANWLHLVEHQNLLFFGPFILLLEAIFVLFGYFSNRQSNFKLIGTAAIFRTGITALITITAGYFHSTPLTLLSAHLLGLFASLIYFDKNYRLLNLRSAKKHSHNIHFLLKEYRKYPIYSASFGVLNSITVAMPVFFISNYYSAEIVGYYAFLVRVVNAPLSFLSRAVSHVNINKIIQLVKAGTNPIPYTIKISLFLFCASAIPFSILFFYSEPIFSLLFGSNWITASVYLQILLPAFLIKFIASTLSASIEATNNAHLGAIWKGSSFVLYLFVFAFFAPQNDILAFMAYLMVMDASLYSLYLLFTLYSVSHPKLSN